MKRFVVFGLLFSVLMAASVQAFYFEGRANYKTGSSGATTDHKTGGASFSVGDGGEWSYTANSSFVLELHTVYVYADSGKIELLATGGTSGSFVAADGLTVAWSTNQVTDKKYVITFTGSATPVDPEPEPEPETRIIEWEVENDSEEPKTYGVFRVDPETGEIDDIAYDSVTLEPGEKGQLSVDATDDGSQYYVAEWDYAASQAKYGGFPVLESGSYQDENGEWHEWSYWSGVVPNDATATSTKSYADGRDPDAYPGAEEGDGKGDASDAGIKAAADAIVGAEEKTARAIAAAIDEQTGDLENAIEGQTDAITDAVDEGADRTVDAINAQTGAITGAIEGQTEDLKTAIAEGSDWDKQMKENYDARKDFNPTSELATVRSQNPGINTPSGWTGPSLSSSDPSLPGGFSIPGPTGEAITLSWSASSLFDLGWAASWGRGLLMVAAGVWLMRSCMDAMRQYIIGLGSVSSASAGAQVGLESMVPGVPQAKAVGLAIAATLIISAAWVALAIVVQSVGGGIMDILGGGADLPSTLGVLAEWIPFSGLLTIYVGRAGFDFVAAPVYLTAVAAQKFLGV
ncbi:hypothetical protein H5P28_07055 [Ruficoccus amylovorans]|uniref:Uncharacterized protein n=1 Tax=Ruficoccus amylovorans TaxID=1804625 RepID=A0A842HEL3_9BACT|nr:hypothetical protein [Ruficoccus amylovorans]MBC2594017.1 hypothetical protein [Ruficoccus amylovorans]